MHTACVWSEKLPFAGYSVVKDHSAPACRPSRHLRASLVGPQRPTPLARSCSIVSGSVARGNLEGPAPLPRSSPTLAVVDHAAAHCITAPFGTAEPLTFQRSSNS